MATFVTLSRDNTGDITHVNLDCVYEMERIANYTLLKFNGGPSSAVKETPSEILDQARRAANNPKK